MTVSLEYDPTSQTGGISRLRRLASFGRYGADVHASARSDCNKKASSKRCDKKDISLLAASLSSFYGWSAKQSGCKATLGNKSNKLVHKLQAQKQVSGYDACLCCFRCSSNLVCAACNKVLIRHVCMRERHHATAGERHSQDSSVRSCASAIYAAPPYACQAAEGSTATISLHHAGELVDQLASCQ